jgi:nucleoside-diphosphate-sugar epimerase
MATAFVTGGSGFIGDRLIERLRAEGHAVRGLARSLSAAERIRARGGEPVPGDLADVAACAPAPPGVRWLSTPRRPRRLGAARSVRARQRERDRERAPRLRRGRR